MIILTPRLIIFIRGRQACATPDVLHHVALRRTLGWRGLAIDVQHGHSEDLSKIGASHPAQAERRERHACPLISARSLQQDALVIENHLAQLRILLHSEFFAGFNIVERLFLLAKLELAQAKHGARSAIFRIESDYFSELTRRCPIVIFLVVNFA